MKVNYKCHNVKHRVPLGIGGPVRPRFMWTGPLTDASGVPFAYTFAVYWARIEYEWRIHCVKRNAYNYFFVQDNMPDPLEGFEIRLANLPQIEVDLGVLVIFRPGSNEGTYDAEVTVLVGNFKEAFTGSGSTLDNDYFQDIAFGSHNAIRHYGENVGKSWWIQDGLRGHTEILIHSGFSDWSRGSAGCLTIAPGEWGDFLSATGYNTGNTSIVVYISPNVQTMLSPIVIRLVP